MTDRTAKRRPPNIDVSMELESNWRRDVWRSILDMQLWVHQRRPPFTLMFCFRFVVSSVIGLVLPELCLPHGLPIVVFILLPVCVSAGIMLFLSFVQLRDAAMEKHHSLEPCLAGSFTLVALLAMSVSSSIWLPILKSAQWELCDFYDLGPHEVARFLIGGLCTPCHTRTFYLEHLLADNMEGLIAKSLEGLGWKQTFRPVTAAISFETHPQSGRYKFAEKPHRRSRCFVHPVATSDKSNARISLAIGPLGLFPFIPEIAIKDQFLTRLYWYYSKTVEGENAASPSREALLQDMFSKWDFVPETYSLDDPWQRKLFLDQVPCQGPNSMWLLKGKDHGGRSIQKFKTYEELWQDLELDCQHFRSTGEIQQLRGKLHHHKHQQHSEYYNKWYVSGRAAQKVVPGLLWPGLPGNSASPGRRFDVRVFMLIVKVPGNEVGTDVQTAGFVELYMSSLLVFIIHDGLVTDFHTDSIQFQTSKELNAWVDPSGNWVQRVLLPELSRILSISFNASAEPDPDPQQHRIRDSFEESDGVFEFIAGDFLITEELGVKMIDFSARPQMHRLGELTPHLRDVLVDDTVWLLFKLFGQDPHTARPTQHWQRVARLPALPHI